MPATTPLPGCQQPVTTDFAGNLFCQRVDAPCSGADECRMEPYVAPVPSIVHYDKMDKICLNVGRAMQEHNRIVEALDQLNAQGCPEQATQRIRDYLLEQSKYLQVAYATASRRPGDTGQPKEEQE